MVFHALSRGIARMQVFEKSVEEDDHFLAVARYVERNGLESAYRPSGRPGVAQNHKLLLE